MISSRIDRCLNKVGNRFMLATIISRRWEQLVTGGRPMVSTRDPRSMAIPFEEIEEDKLALNTETMTVERHGEPVEPPAPLEGFEDLLAGPLGELPAAAAAEEEEEEVEADDEEE